jgi:integrase
MSPAPAPPAHPHPAITLGDYVLEHYLPRKCPTWSTGTRTFREWAVREVLLPDLGHRPITEMTHAEVERWIGWRAITAFTSSGRLPRRATLQSLLKTLGAVMRLAMLDGIVPTNPVTGLRLPPDLSDPPTVWSTEQVRQFLALTAHTRYATLWRVLFATGLRRGEALGVTWADVNAERATISVRRSLQAHSRSGNYHYGPPKTRLSRRTLSVDPGTLDALAAWRTRQDAEFARRGESVTPADPVFTTVAGTPMLPSCVSDAWRAAVKKTGLPRMRLHDIRHTHLSHLLGAGEPIVHVAARAGHGSAYQTLTTYAHLIPGDDERTAARAGQLFAAEG